MATKKDSPLKENMERGTEANAASEDFDSTKNKHAGERNDDTKTIVKNANATGLGTMGRNDQTQTGHTFEHLEDA